MSAPWFLFSLLAPAAIAAAVAFVLRGRRAEDPAVILLNALVPGAGIAAAGRPLVEVAAGVVFSAVSLLTVGGLRDISYWVPIMAVGAVWGTLHTRFNPLTRERPAAPATSAVSPMKPARPPQASAPLPPARVSGDPQRPGDGEEETGYAVSLRCTECGASLDVSVLQHMTRCPFCGSDHLVIGHDARLELAIPEQILNPGNLRGVILDHYRYLHYLALYRRHVAPLERRADESSPQSALSGGSHANPAATAMERVISVKADAYRARLEPKLRLEDPIHFLAPYRHGMGTLFQAAFGRSPSDQEKALRFAIATVEAATLATTAANLPPMGRLSYLRALRPVSDYPDHTRVLPLEGDDTDLARAFGDVDRKRLVRDFTVIRQRSILTRDVTAVVWRPWWLVGVRGPGLDETLLVDSAAGSVVGPAPPVDRSRLGPLPEESRATGSGLRFMPMECPTCGFEFTFDVNARLHFCSNCHRVFRVDGGRKVEVGYDRAAGTSRDANDIVPFWRFDLRLRTGDGALVTDLSHFKDGIDGTLDQVGTETAFGQHQLFVPAFRCVNSRLMVQAFGRLVAHSLSQAQRLEPGRFPLDEKPCPWPVGLDEDEARELAPLYLALAFDRKDLARANVHQVGTWLFDTRLEAQGRLTYLRVPRPVTETFRAYVGRFRARALAAAATGRTA